MFFLKQIKLFCFHHIWYEDIYLHINIPYERKENCKKGYILFYQCYSQQFKCLILIIYDNSYLFYQLYFSPRKKIFDAFENVYSNFTVDSGGFNHFITLLWSNRKCVKASKRYRTCSINSIFENWEEKKTPSKLFGRQMKRILCKIG